MATLGADTVGIGVETATLGADAVGIGVGTATLGAGTVGAGAVELGIGATGCARAIPGGGLSHACCCDSCRFVSDVTPRWR
jgi:hypothetical protein